MIGGGIFQVGAVDAKKMRRGSAKRNAPKGSKSETSLHWHVAGLLDKHLAEPAWFTTFPAGGGGEMRGKILKGLGLKSGVPDILIVMPMILNVLSPGHSMSGYVANPVMAQLLYWIELKKTGGGSGPTEIQIKTQQKLIEMGCRVANCDSLESVKAALSEWGLPYQGITPTEANLRNNLKLALANV